MPFDNPMQQRFEMIRLANMPGANRTKIAKRFGVSRKTLYEWLGKNPACVEDCRDKTKRPVNSPNKTHSDMEAEVIALRLNHPTWGGRKLARRLKDIGRTNVPSPSTITSILHRHGLITAKASEAAKHWQRFERENPNELWQMDFKGDFGFGTSNTRCHPLTILDDCSRYNLCLKACTRQTHQTVQGHLIDTFRLYGMPLAMLADNGPPWGSSNPGSITKLEVWLLRLGIHVTHGRPFHPQTQGKEERFHRTLKQEVLQGRSFADLPSIDREFTNWRHVYNYERPHDALDLDTPAKHYAPSGREYPEVLPELEYAENAEVRAVKSSGAVRFKGRTFGLSHALYGQKVVFKPTKTDGKWKIYFMTKHIGTVNLRHVKQGEYKRIYKAEGGECKNE